MWAKSIERGHSFLITPFPVERVWPLCSHEAFPEHKDIKLAFESRPCSFGQKNINGNNQRPFHGIKHCDFGVSLVREVLGIECTQKASSRGQDLFHFCELPHVMPQTRHACEQARTRPKKHKLRLNQIDESKWLNLLASVYSPVS
jgi:hypothetical protein